MPAIYWILIYLSAVVSIAASLRLFISGIRRMRADAACQRSNRLGAGTTVHSRPGTSMGFPMLIFGMDAMVLGVHLCKMIATHG